VNDRIYCTNSQIQTILFIQRFAYYLKIAELLNHPFLFYVNDINLLYLQYLRDLFLRLLVLQSLFSSCEKPFFLLRFNPIMPMENVSSHNMLLKMTNKEIY
jgi:hypothetical protein